MTPRSARIAKIIEDGLMAVNGTNDTAGLTESSKHS